jgi:hypothetical protein
VLAWRGSSRTVHGPSMGPSPVNAVDAVGPLRFERKSTAPQAARIPSFPMQTRIGYCFMGAFLRPTAGALRQGSIRPLRTPRGASVAIRTVRKRPLEMTVSCGDPNRSKPGRARPGALARSAQTSAPPRRKKSWHEGLLRVIVGARVGATNPPDDVANDWNH